MKDEDVEVDVNVGGEKKTEEEEEIEKVKECERSDEEVSALTSGEEL